MIDNATELNVAMRQLIIMKEALQALRHQLAAANPDLLRVAEKAYVRRIATLTEDIFQYLWRGQF